MPSRSNRHEGANQSGNRGVWVASNWGTGMKRRRWEPDEKTRIVLEHMGTRISTAALCKKYGVSPTTLQSWKEQFVLGGKKALATRGSGSGECSTHERQLVDLTHKVGEMTMVIDVLKKNLGGMKR